ncbi:MAG: transporter substrate-binding domain-containing protein [Rhodospirillales bacterium]|nr:transporter substrate-binding domain-containing protein [Rhodospirillales bacterium]
MKQVLTVMLATIVAIIASYSVVNITAPENGVSPVSEEKQKETTYERVMRTGTIRCGYIDYSPHLIVDPATGKKSGITHDIMEEAARLLGLKIDWAEELGWGNTVTAIESNRVDAICTSFWQNPVEGRYLGFTIPLFYSAVGAYVKEDDHRFDGGLSDVDSPEIRISATDGNMAFLVAGQDFPSARLVSLPNMTDETTQMLEVATGKADITFVETYLGEQYRKNNPGTLRNVIPDNPIRVFGNTIAIPQDDVRFQSMLNAALVQLLNGGFVEKTIRKYEEVDGGIYRAAKPYQ